jgi:hypothetical protein
MPGPTQTKPTGAHIKGENKMKFTTAISAALAAILCTASAGQAAETMRFGHVGGPGSLY